MLTDPILHGRARALARAAVAAIPLCIALAATSPPAMAAGPSVQEPTSTSALAGAPNASAVATRDACSAPEPGQASCLAVGLVSARTGTLISVRPQRSTGAASVVGGSLEAAPPAFGSAASPAQSLAPASEPAATVAPEPGTPLYLQQAYDLTALSASAGSGTTVAVVDAYNDPSAAADLAYYRSYYGLPACTGASGCLRIVGQDGSLTLPSDTFGGWQTEESLDLDAVSALCPNCRLLLVEANGPTWSDLEQAEASAVTDGATIISNSWSGNGPISTVPAPSFFSYPGVAILAASGDSGWDGGDTNNAWPAALGSVTAVGGTTLSTSDTARGFTETAWSGSGSGCSEETKPTYETDSGCAGRSYSDLSADADPQTGLAVYDSAEGGWSVWGGTSLSTPLTAAYYALVGEGAGQGSAAWAYSNSALLNDPSSGSNDGGAPCTAPYICIAVAGYDGPTGIGSISGDVVAGAPGIGGPGPDTYLSAQTATSATLSAGIWPNDEETSYYVEYGTTDAYGQATASTSAGSGSGVADVTATLSGLTPDTDYHYRLVAVNALGTTYGYDETIAGGAPTVTITSQPLASSTATSGAVDYAESAGVSSTACTLDGTAIPCSTSSASLTDLGVGTHTFVVTVTGTGGSGSATAAFAVVALAAPTVTITNPPAEDSTSTYATVTYAETGAVTSTACELDGFAVASCTGSTASLTSLSVGAHTFTVEVIGPGGIDTASATFLVGAVPLPADPTTPAPTPAPILRGTPITTPIAAVWTRVSVVALGTSACTSRGCPALGATLRFTLAEKARVTIGLFRETSGARRLIATRTVAQAVGADRLEIGSLFTGQTVAPGSYTLTAYATPEHATGRSRRVSSVFRATLRVG
jgi:hypothetical protein